jgi:hypothetical protein
MRAKISLIILACLFALTVPSLLRAQVPTLPKTPDVAGIWTMTMKGPQGEIIMTMDATFTQDKEAIKVSMMSPMGVEMKGGGTIKGQELQWTMANITKPDDVSLGFKAKLDGDTMTGEVQMGDFGTATFSAQKKK